MLPECAMDEPQGKGLWGLQGHQLQLRYLGWVGGMDSSETPPRGHGSHLAFPLVPLAPTCRE